MTFISSQSHNNESINHIEFERLFRELYPQLLRYCTQFVRNQLIAEEIVQEKFIHLWEKRDEIKIYSSYKSYLYAAVRNKCIDYIRQKYKRSFVTLEEITNFISDDIQPSQLMEFRELTDLITKAVEELPDKCFIVFSLHRYGNLKRKEIAEQLNISEKTVDNHLAYAIKKIKAFLLNNNLLQLLIF